MSNSNICHLGEVIKFWEPNEYIWLPLWPLASGFVFHWWHLNPDSKQKSWNLAPTPEASGASPPFGKGHGGAAIMSQWSAGKVSHTRIKALKGVTDFFLFYSGCCYFFTSIHWPHSTSWLWQLRKYTTFSICVWFQLHPSLVSSESPYWCVFSVCSHITHSLNIKMPEA